MTIQFLVNFDWWYQAIIWNTVDSSSQDSRITTIGVFIGPPLFLQVQDDGLVDFAMPALYIQMCWNAPNLFLKSAMIWLNFYTKSNKFGNMKYIEQYKV